MLFQIDLTGSPPAEVFDQFWANRETGEEILGILRTLNAEQNLTIVMVTHDPVAASYADRIVFLEDGVTSGEMLDPTTDMVIDRMRTLGGRPE